MQYQGEKTFRLLLLCVFVIVISAIAVNAQFFNDDFSAFDTSLYNLYHNAIYDSTNNNIELTYARRQAGRCYLDIPFEMDYFLVEFDFYIGGGSCGDGMVFAFTENQNYSSSYGEWLDFSGAIGYGIVINTYQNSGDPVGDYVGLVKDGPKNPLAYWEADLRNAWHNMKVQNLLGYICVFIDDTLRIDYQIPDYVAYTGYLGFTAATYNAWDYHRVDNFIIHHIAGIPAISIAPMLDSTSIGGKVEYTLSVTNYDTMAVNYWVTLTGLDSSWYEITEPSFSLLSGQSKQDAISFDIPSQPGIADAYLFNVDTYVSSIDSTITKSATLKVVNNPIMESVYPLDGTITSSSSVDFSWFTSAICSTEVYLKESDSTIYQVYSSEPEREHLLTISDLERNRSYDWYARSAGDCGGVRTSEIRQFYIDNGVVFSYDAYYDTISRNYDQRFTVGVRNADSAYHSVWLETDNPYSDLAVNFIGDGSLDNQLLLNPSQTDDITIAVHAQDANQHNYSIPIRLTSITEADTIVDFSMLNIYVNAMFIDASFEEVSIDSGTLAKNYRFINYGDPITDLSITASDSLNSHIYFEPQISHALVQTNDILIFKAIPILIPTDTSIIVGLKAKGKEVKFSSDLLLSFDGVITAGFADTNFNLNANFDPPPGETVWLAHVENTSQCFSRADWYCTNRPEIYMDYRIPPMKSPENAFFQFDLTPMSGWNQQPHSVYVYINDHLIGSIENTIPDGTYNFAIDTDFMNFSPSQVSVNRVHLQTTHMNGGHYVVSTNMSICLCINSMERYISAESQEQANQRLLVLMGVLPSNISIMIDEPAQDQNIDLGQAAIIRATVLADSQPGVNTPVKASFNNGDNTIVLFDDGNHGDMNSNDGVYANTWNTANQGACQVVTRAGDCSVYGTDTVNVNVIGPTSIELVIQSPPEDFRLAINRAAQLLAEVKDNFNNLVPGSELINNCIDATFNCEPSVNIQLLDDGNHGDMQSNDGIYAAIWAPNPEEMGACEITFNTNHSTLGDAQTVVSGEITFPSILVLDGKPENPDPICLKTCRVYKIETDGSEQYLGVTITDSSGILYPDTSWFQQGVDRIKLEIDADTLWTPRRFHSAVDSIAAILIIDNAFVQETGPLVYEDIFSGEALQAIKLMHTTAKFNLTIGIEWDASTNEMENLETAFRRVANHLYDVSDGQATLGKIEIFDNGCGCCENSSRFLSADIRIYARNNFGNFVAQGGQGFMGLINGGCENARISMPRVVYADDNNNNSILQNMYGIDWCVRDTYASRPDLHYYDPGVRALSHELCHYLLYLNDEKTGPPEWYGIMNLALRYSTEEPMYGEMSSSKDYEDESRRNTGQWDNFNMSCWDLFDTLFCGSSLDEINSLVDSLCPLESSASPYRHILQPGDADQPQIPFTGPNNDILNPDIDCGSALVVNLENSGSVDAFYAWLTFFDEHFLWKKWVFIQLLCGIIPQGYTAFDNKILLVGGSQSDIAFASQLWFDPVSRSNKYDFGEITIAPVAMKDSLQMEMNEITPTHPLAIKLVASAPEALRLEANFTIPFNQPPSIELSGAGGTSYDENLSQTSDSYISSDAIISGEDGHIIIAAFDDSSLAFKIPIQYNWVTDENGNGVHSASSYDGNCTVTLDTLFQATDAVLISNYHYLFPTNGLPIGVTPASPFFSISFYPPNGSLPGDNFLSISYSIPDSLAIDPSDLKLYYWGTDTNWNEIPGELDTLYVQYIASFSEEGIYVLGGQVPSSGYQFLPGDANMINGQWPPQVIGGDVTYLVNYFRGITSQCLVGGFFCSADANGDCSVIGSDVTKLVAYFRGLTQLSHCPDYSPAWLTPDDLPEEMPSGWPGCETVIISSTLKENTSIDK